MKKIQYKRIISIVLVLILVFFVNSCENGTLSKFFDKLEIPSEVSENLNLLEEYYFNNKTIKVSWYSSNPQIIETNGKVHLKEEEIKVTLIATAMLNNATMKKVYNVKTISDNSESILQSVVNKIFLPNYLDKDINLPTEKTSNNKTITIVWESSHENIIDNTGKVTLGEKETVVTITGHFTCGDFSLDKNFEITVPQDPNFTNGEAWARAKVYFDSIDNATYPEKLSEFPGAVYYKVNSSTDWWDGIEVVVQLPEWIPDTGRTGVNPYQADCLRYLDNPSVYLGNHCLYESDVGLSWMVGSRDANCSGVNYEESIAFRPFWRYYSEDKKNTFQNAPWTSPEFYYYPGDIIRMSVYNSSKGKMQLRIELLQETTIEKYVKRRASFLLGDNYEKVFTSPEFNSFGATTNKSSFKRVCALDQVSNEGKATQPTNAISQNVLWKEVYLYRNINGTEYKVPMTSRYAAEIGSPKSTNILGDFSNTFKISYENVSKELGGQAITISPNNRK